MNIDLPKLKRSPVTVKQFDALHRPEFQFRPAKQIHRAGAGFRTATNKPGIPSRKASAQSAALPGAKVCSPAREQIIPCTTAAKQASEGVWLVALGQFLFADSRVNSQPEDTEGAESDPG